MIINTEPPKNNTNISIFWLELSLAMIILLILWLSMIPTNILNSSPVWMALERIGLGGSVLVFFAGIPVGIMGIRKAKKMKKLRIVTTTLSILNLFAGIIEIGILILIFWAAIFRGASV